MTPFFLDDADALASTAFPSVRENAHIDHNPQSLRDTIVTVASTSRPSMRLTPLPAVPANNATIRSWRFAVASFCRFANRSPQLRRRVGHRRHLNWLRPAFRHSAMKWDHL